MSGAYLRAAEPGDEAALRGLWQAVFHDEEAVIDAFFDCLYAPEDVLLAEQDGELVSAAYLLRGVKLVSLERAAPAAYFYALATRPDRRGRGLGRAITLSCIRTCAQRGETLCLMPGEESLRRWYAGFAGLHSFGTACRLESAAVPESKIETEEIGAADYAARREKLLSDTPHAALPTGFFRFQESLSRLGNGALLALHGASGAEGLACVERCDDTASAAELLWTDRAEEAAAAVAAHFGAARCVARTPGEGLQTVMGANAPYSAPFWWGPVFD